MCPGAMQGDTKVGGIVSKEEDQISYKRNLDDFVDQSDRNKMTFNSAECKLMQSFNCGD